jgi:hypothetical protein
VPLHAHAADRESVLIHTQPCTVATVPRSTVYHHIQSKFGTTMTTKKFWELGRTRLGDGKASNADYSNADYSNADYASVITAVGTGVAAILRTTDF